MPSITLELSYRMNLAGVAHSLTIEATVTVGKPAPPCSDPDSPRFSDEGDPGEIHELVIVESDTGLSKAAWSDASVALYEDAQLRDRVMQMAMDRAADQQYAARSDEL